MKKGKVIFIAALLIVSSVLMHFLMNDNNTKYDADLIGIFIGFVFGVGIGTLILVFFEKRNNQ